MTNTISSSYCYSYSSWQNPSANSRIWIGNSAKVTTFPLPLLILQLHVCVCVCEREREREKKRIENLADRMEDVLAQSHKILSNSSDQNTSSPLPQAPKKGGKTNYKKKKKGRRIYSAAEVQRMPITAPGRRTLLRKGRMAMVEGRSKCSAIALCSQVTHVQKNKRKGRKTRVPSYGKEAAKTRSQKKTQTHTRQKAHVGNTEIIDGQISLFVPLREINPNNQST